MMISQQEHDDAVSQLEKLKKQKKVYETHLSSVNTTLQLINTSASKLKDSNEYFGSQGGYCIDGVTLGDEGYSDFCKYISDLCVDLENLKKTIPIYINSCNSEIDYYTMLVNCPIKS